MALDLPKIENKILKFWQKNRVFEESLERTKKGPRFVFYEGPPFANGLPGIHHLLARAFKDIILRYKTMQGFFVERRAGWDTHGLPVEMDAEKKLDIKSKKEIEKVGVDKFIEVCRNSVFTYKKEWEEFTERIGFWLDFKNAYITCSNKYIESLWWILKQIWEKGLLYRDYKVVPYCPRCGTSLSSHEVAQGYKTVTEKTITVKFELIDEPGTYILVWTTTPWTLPGNVALAVNPDIEYVKFSLKDYPRISDGIYIVSKKDFDDYKNEIKKNEFEKGAEIKIVSRMKGRNLIGKKYKPLYPSEAPYKIVSGDFVSVEEGTGIVHMAPAFGEDDMEVAKENNLPILVTVDKEGKMLTKGYPWHNKFVKEADSEIIDDLAKRDILFHIEDYEHEYPFCWRCKTPLLYYAKTSWFIKMTVLRKELIKNNQKINWAPTYIKEGRFGEWLKEVKDWNLSRERYWGTSLPIWQCQAETQNSKLPEGKPLASCGAGKTKNHNSKLKTEKCSNIKVIGSIKELEKLSGKKVKELHRPFIDEITFKCDKCGKEMKRAPEVLDCWFDSGSMPFAQWHYPFENKERIDKGIFFPADYISEAIDQTRGWFYTLLAISTLLGFGPSYKNVVCYGLVLDAEGQKMSKSRGNIVMPKEVTDKFGADCARFYFYTLNSEGDAKRFDFKDIQNLYRKFFDTLWQSYNFFSIYKEKGFKEKENFQSGNLLDKWIVSRLENLNEQVVKNLDNFQIVSAARLFEKFIDDLSNWYIRRSRQRFQELDKKEEASQTLYYVLLRLSKLLAPFTPFIAEELYQGLGGKEKSVHLDNYPEPKENLINKNLGKQMEKVRRITVQALAQRAEAGIKVRQPLSELRIKDYELKDKGELLNLIKDEINVKKVIFDGKIKKEAELDTKITEELKKEGSDREQIRNVNQLRKEAGYTPEIIITDVTGTSIIYDVKIFREETKSKSYKKVDSEEDIDEKKYIKKKVGEKNYIAIPKLSKNQITKQPNG